jgi:hypothetical protein
MIGALLLLTGCAPTGTPPAQTSAVIAPTAVVSLEDALTAECATSANATARLRMRQASESGRLSSQATTTAMIAGLLTAELPVLATIAQGYGSPPRYVAWIEELHLATESYVAAVRAAGKLDYPGYHQSVAIGDMHAHSANRLAIEMKVSPCTY